MTITADTWATPATLTRPSRYPTSTGPTPIPLNSTVTSTNSRLCKLPATG